MQSLLNVRIRIYNNINEANEVNEWLPQTEHFIRFCWYTIVFILPFVRYFTHNRHIWHVKPGVSNRYHSDWFDDRQCIVERTLQPTNSSFLQNEFYQISRMTWTSYYYYCVYEISFMVFKSNTLYRLRIGQAKRHTSTSCDFTGDVYSVYNNIISYVNNENNSHQFNTCTTRTYQPFN